MIRTDLHVHTRHSHGKDTVAAMLARAGEKNLRVLGFSEHSPRPPAYSYACEYREHLAATFPDYVRAVIAARENPWGMSVLLGMELDYLPAEPEFMTRAKEEWPFEYVIGGIHFLGEWGFDATAADWREKDAEACARLYERYFDIVTDLARSGLANILAHPDIIKIFSAERFRSWMETARARDQVRTALEAVRDNGMAMEISSAGLRKPCQEIYPGPRLMELASELRVPVTFASDAHCVSTLAAGFDTLETYARQYGFTRYAYFQNNDIHFCGL